MDQGASWPISSAAVILVIVLLAAGILNLVFGHALHLEPIGLLGFGIFCIGYGVAIPWLFRQRERKGAAVPSSKRRTADPRGPIMVREQRRAALPATDSCARPCHALTIDLEDYFHSEVAAQGISFADWEKQPSRIEASTHRLLELLDGSHTRGTFFVLGWAAKRYPRLVHEIHQRGHEIGCHSLDHRPVSRISPAEFLESTRTAKDLIESVIQEPIFGYRAPCFSITPGCEWAFDVLVRLGFTYDSSVHPLHHPFYGSAKAPRNAHAVAGGQLMEFPIATWRVAGRNLSVGGSAYLRLLPYPYIQRGLRAWEKEMQSPATVYLQPWEIDPYQPYIRLSLQSTIRQTWGTRAMEEKLQNLLGQFQFAPVREAHRALLEGSRQQPVRKVFQFAEAVEQVAG